jgi:hypothetical protein
MSARQRPSSSASAPGDPDATGDAIPAVVDAEQPPLRILLGGPPLQIAPDAYQRRLATWDAWVNVTIAGQGDPPG